MTRNIFVFLGTFLVGAVIALVVRAAAFKPHANHAGHPAAAGDYAPQVSNPLTPANALATPPAPAANKSESASHANHGAAAGKPVNSICAICGMEVDPSLPTLQYQGQTIGFGCKMCAPKFKADPDRYGPLYLKNETVKR